MDQVQGNHKKTGMNDYYAYQDYNYLHAQLPCSSTKVPQDSQLPDNYSTPLPYYHPQLPYSSAQVADNSHLPESSLVQNNFATHGLNNFAQPYFDPKQCKYFKRPQESQEKIISQQMKHKI